MREKKDLSFREKIANSLELPKDLVMQAPILTITGQKEALIENYKGIIEYEDSVILVQAKNCKIKISGQGLAIDYYTNEEMKIAGIIQLVEYQR